MMSFLLQRNPLAAVDGSWDPTRGPASVLVIAALLVWISYQVITWAKDRAERQRKAEQQRNKQWLRTRCERDLRAQYEDELEQARRAR